jgi:hypothetical protein
MRSAKQRTETYVTVLHPVRQKRKTHCHYSVQLDPVASLRITVQILSTDSSDLLNEFTHILQVTGARGSDSSVQRPVHGLNIRDIALRFPPVTRDFSLL